MPDQPMKTLLTAAGAGAAGGAIAGVGAALGFAPLGTVWPVVAVCAVAGGLVHNAKHAITQMVDNRTHTLRNRVERLQRDLGDVHGLVRLLPYTKDLPLPIGGGWALTGDSAAILVREALLRKPRALLELGSGVSTLLLGQLLRNLGEGHLLSIDHDRAWAERTRKNVEFLGLGEHITVVDAPLKRIEVQGHAFDWYDIPPDQLDRLGPIELLLVDGPPPAAHQAVGARYPALPLLADRLAPTALIFVDDASRPAETAMVERWLAQNPGWAVERHDTVDGVCLLSRAAGLPP
jgi:predicted O-methyltransferase YrrM